MSAFLSEFVGTSILLLLGNGVVANVVLSKTKGNGSGWIVISFGWAMAVFVGVYTTAAASGAHLNPAITIGLAIKTNHWGDVPFYILAQMLGAMFGSFLVWVSYKQHFDETENKDLKMAVFCTTPAIKNPINNFLSEMIATFVLMLGVLFISKADMKLGALDALPVAFLVLAIGLSLGGSTGYAINPARDLGSRLAHFLLPIKNKRDSDWAYSWIPVIAPITGAIIAVWIYALIA